jgi:flagellar biosynthesis protein FlhA
MKTFSKIAVPIGIVSIVLMLVVPLPAPLLDVLIAGNIAVSMLVLLVVLQIKKPLEFASFPSLLLVLTMLRLALNVSSTRLVLSDGYAGKVIEAFGHFVIAGSLVVGLVVFAILCVIQFVVITNGAGRVAEVGARFSLDAMAPKHMAIDAQLVQGAITQEEAERKRAEVSGESDFYGAMDGASKFVKGDAIAAVIVTLINLLGGLGVGMLSKGMSASEALNHYAMLTIGDGLVTQIPALLMSTATGLLVTRSAANNDMGSELMSQLVRHKQPLKIAGFSALALMVMPGLPKWPFLIVGVGLLVAGYRKDPAIESDQPVEETVPDGPSPDSPEAIAEATRVDPLELELAYDLIPLADPTRGGDLLDRVKALRKKVAMDTGLVMPLVRTRDNLDLASAQYVIRLNGNPVAKGIAPAGSILAIGDRLASLPGTDTHEPVFGLAAKWVPENMRRQAEITGATVVDRSSVITTHMAEVVKDFAPDLLSREAVRVLVDMVKKTNPVVIDELTPVLDMGEVQRVLQGLLKERVPIRDLVRIFEALTVAAKSSKDIDSLVEACRASLGPAVSAQYIKDDRLAVLTIQPMLEAALLEAIRPSDRGLVLSLDTDRLNTLVESATAHLSNAETAGSSPVLVCSTQVRGPLARLMHQVIPRLPVLSYEEMSRSVPIEAMGVVGVQ